MNSWQKLLIAAVFAEILTLGGAGMLFLAGVDLGSPFILAFILIVGAAPLGVVGFTASKRDDFERRDDLKKFFGYMNLHANFRPKQSDAALALEDLAHIAHRLPGAPSGVTLLAHPEGQPESPSLIEHVYSMTRGSSSHKAIHSIAIMSCPNSWPRMTLTSARLADKMGEHPGMQDVQAGDERFRRRWRVRSSDPSFVEQALSEDLQSYLRPAPQDEMWEIGEGRICCIRRAPITPESAGEFAARPGRFLRHVPAELKEWKPLFNDPVFSAAA